jgi:hypothetical protein
VHPVKILAPEFKGQPLTDEQRIRISEYVRNAIIQALADAYPAVNEPSAETAELRVAITDVYKRGDRVGLTIEGEVLDSYSAVQVAGAMRSALGEAHAAPWWEAASAREMIDKFAKRLRWIIDTGHRR